MKISLLINRIKRNNTIVESFTLLPPNNPFLNQTNRMLSHFVWILINKHTIGGDLCKLLDIIEGNQKIIYVYEYNNINIKLNEIIEFEYYPFLGTKTCSHCYNEIIINNKSYCYKKGKQNMKNDWYKCLYWCEKSMGEIKNRYGRIFKPRGSETNGLVDK